MSIAREKDEIQRGGASDLYQERSIIIPSGFRAVSYGKNDEYHSYIPLSENLFVERTPSFVGKPAYRVENMESWLPTKGAGRGRLGFDKGFVVNELLRSRTTLTKNGLTQGEEIADNVDNFLRLKEGDVVVDLGSGPGVIAKRLAEKTGQTGWLYAVDASEGMLVNTRKNLEGARATIIHGDIHVVDKLIAEKVDAVVLSGNVHLLSNPKKAFQAVYNILKPMGRLAVICHAYFYEGSRNHTNIFAEKINKLMHERPDLFPEGLRLPMLSQQELNAVVMQLKKIGFYVSAHESDTWSPDGDDVFGIPPTITVKSRLKAMLSEQEDDQKLDALASLVLSDINRGRPAQMYLCCVKKSPAVKFSPSGGWLGL